MLDMLDETISVFVDLRTLCVVLSSLFLCYHNVTKERFSMSCELVPSCVLLQLLRTEQHRSELFATLTAFDLDGAVMSCLVSHASPLLPLLEKNNREN